MSRLAPDLLKITIDDNVVTLRPTLRAAYRLNLKFNGFQPLAVAILEGDLGAMADVIDEAADYPAAITDLLRDLAINGASRVTILQEPLLAYLAQLVGLDDLTKDEQPATPAAAPAKTISRTEYYDRLFAIGTGWLGYTAAETWSMAPAELEAAYAGRLDLLKAIFGSSDEQKDQDREAIPLSQRAKAAIAALGGKVVKRPKAST